jgi:hypothetical protein
MTNRNAYVGKNVETLFKNSIGAHKEILDKIRDVFKIEGHFSNAISSGIQNEKVAVKMEFSCGRNIDANIKAFKIGLNQLTRTTCESFCKDFDINCFKWLQNLVIEKAKKGTSNMLFFPIEEQYKAIEIISTNY